VQERPIEIALKVVDHVDALLGYWDRDLRCRFANAAYRTWFGRNRDDILGMSMQELLGPLFELNLPHVLKVLGGEVQIFEREIPLPDGSVRHSLASYYPDIVGEEVIGFSVQVADVTRMKELERELQAAKLKAEMLAHHDFLTGLPNRVRLEDTIAFGISQAEKSGSLVGVASIDMDGFKQINDTHGHKTGDEFLREVAVRMKSVLRGVDTVARHGGDEFIFVARELDTVESLRRVVERLVYAVCRPWMYQGVVLIPSRSCGVSCFPADGRSTEELLAAADSAMYQAKKMGKNQIVFAASGL
jgi:diguanylate cyclase (GGDEF)-like protein/PAS domain S-box-containing protein